MVARVPVVYATIEAEKARASADDGGGNRATGCSQTSLAPFYFANLIGSKDENKVFGGRIPALSVTAPLSRPGLQFRTAISDVWIDRAHRYHFSTDDGGLAQSDGGRRGAYLARFRSSMRERDNAEPRLQRAAGQQFWRRLSYGG
jgi:hypothetical protein